jgi:single-strand DNA-binding protein
MASSRSENLVILIGNLTRDPNLRYTANGTAVVDFGVATNRVWTTPDGDNKEEVEFHQIVAWNKLAEICNQILKKGDKVYIRGSLKTRTWEDDNGTKHYRTEVKSEDMKLLFSRNGERVGAPDEVPATEEIAGELDDFNIDDLADTSKKDDKKEKKEDKPKAAKNADKKKSIDDVDLEDDDLPF